MSSIPEKNQGKQSPAVTDRRYVEQIRNLLQTAIRMKNDRVIAALSGLLLRRGGLA
jgi:hypothetical protein